MKNKGQIQIAVALSLLATFIAAAVGIAWNSNLKSDKAIEKVSAVEGDIKSINTSLQYIQSSLTEIKNQLIKDGKIMMK